jgi:protein N-terminal methyltransferase
VTKCLLLNMFQTFVLRCDSFIIDFLYSVDMVDVTDNFIASSASYLGEAMNARIGNKFVCGLQSFTPIPQRYDVIWVQWVAGHLSDADFIAFFQRCVV